MSLKAPVSARQRRKEARPQELLDAALELFVEKGFSATRSEEVAVRAGVAKGTLYLYFPSKEDLLKAVVRENLGALIAEGADIAGGELRPVNLFETVHVLIFPMLMLCLHKHSLGACAGMGPLMDPHSFIKTHVDVVVRGLLVRADEDASARKKSTKRGPAPQ